LIDFLEIESSIADLAWCWRSIEKIIKRIWRTTCVDFYWL